MEYKTLDDFEFKGKRVLLRSDLNSEVDKGKIILGERIIQSAKTIRELQKKKARVVVLAHQGRKGDKDFTSLKQHAKLLNKHVKIKFVDDTIGGKALAEITRLKDGEAIVLENVRYLEEEMKPSKDNVMVKKLAPLFDIYLNDAFSVSHREQTSIVSFAPILVSGVGRVMQRELESLEKLKMKDTLFLLGGSKAEDELIILKKRDNVLTSGVLAHVVLWAKGIDAGKDSEGLKGYAEYSSKIRGEASRKKIFTPVDLAMKVNGKRKEVRVEDFPAGEGSYDIGKVTVELYKEKIKKAKSIFIKGTMGVCEESQFCYGTKELLNAVVKSKAFSVVGGGHITTAMEKLKINKKKFGYISLSGGALIAYVVREKLPGLEVLKKRGK